MTGEINSIKAVLSIAFIVAGFIVLTIFFYFIPFSPTDKFTIWLWMILAGSMFGLAIFTVLGFESKKALGVIAFVIFWSLIYFAPIPTDFQELVWAAWLFFLVFMLWVHKKYKESRRK
jgi:hypothetical protein